MENQEKYQAEHVEHKKGAPVVMIVSTIILTLGLIALVVLYYNQKSKMVEMEQVLTEEKDSLANELKMMMYGYDTLKTSNDTLNAELLRERNKIQRLLEIQASNAQLIRKYKAEISTMRDIMKSYIVQIDSLNTRNQALTAENTEIKQQMTAVQETNVQLEKTKDELTSKVNIASVIQAKDVVAVALNKKRKETDELRRLDKVRVCFTLRENPIASAGNKIVYLRVVRPDQLVITPSPDNLFEVKGEQLIYSANRAVDYANADVEMCIFLDNTGDFIAGTYTVELYLDGEKIGDGSFVLKGRA
jgi:FtsZ-binding cell division protein ZapB